MQKIPATLALGDEGGSRRSRVRPKKQRRTKRKKHSRKKSPLKNEDTGKFT